MSEDETKREPVESTEKTSFEDADSQESSTDLQPTSENASASATHRQPAQHEPTYEKIKSANTPGALVLQWLTYAFWGWTLVALYWLTGLSVQYFVHQSEAARSYSSDYTNDLLAYPLAAVIVLFVISLICDILYSKFEPRHKTGAAMVIMIIHAVIFALCGIGSLIVAVFAVVNMLISTGTHEGATTTLVTAGVMALLYGATLVRTLHPEKIKRITQLFWVVMLIAAVTIASMGIFGPVAYAQRTKGDQAIEQGLPSIAEAINAYANEKGRLPSSLEDSELRQSYHFSSNEQATKIVDEGLVQYEPKEKMVSAINNNSSINKLDTKKDVYHYRLCATYDLKKNGYDYAASSGDQTYRTYPSTSSHSAGKVCYDLQTDYIY